MTRLANPSLAIAFGAFILCAETCLHAERIFAEGLSELPLYDWIAGGFLLAAGLANARDWPRRTPYQAAGWAFMSSLLVGALIDSLLDWGAPPDPDAWFSDGAMLVILAALSAIALGGLAASLRYRELE